MLQLAPILPGYRNCCGLRVGFLPDILHSVAVGWNTCDSLYLHTCEWDVTGSNVIYSSTLGKMQAGFARFLVSNVRIARHLGNAIATVRFLHASTLVLQIDWLPNLGITAQYGIIGEQ